MNKTRIITSALVLTLMGTLGTALAEESTLKEGAKEVGHATGKAVRQVGEAGKQVGKKVAETAREVGHASRDGAKEFAKAVKGEGSDATPSSASSAPAHQHKTP